MGMTRRSGEERVAVAASVNHSAESSVRHHHESRSSKFVSHHHSDIVIVGVGSGDVRWVQGRLITDVDVVRFGSDGERDPDGRVHRSVEESGLDLRSVGRSSSTHHAQQHGVVRIRVAPLGVVVDEIREVVGHGGEEG